MEKESNKRSFSAKRKEGSFQGKRTTKGSDKPRRRFHSDDEQDNERPARKFGDKKPARKFAGQRGGATSRPRKAHFDDDKPKRRRDVTAESEILTEIVNKRKMEGRQAPRKQKILSLEYEEQYGPIRLNKYIANAGICSRREADTLIETGAIKVNGEIVTELGTKVMPTDEVRYGDRILQREKPVYILLNKPKDYITTTRDEFDRKDVMQLIKGACKERVYPVGRLDRNTTGLLLFTNDGEMAKKLTHPSHNIYKIYKVELDKNLKTSDFEEICNGVELDDGIIKPDEVAYVGDSKREIGITIHSGKNRIVRRIFEHFGYEVVKLDRTVYAGLTKKDLPRGEWRFLTEEDINILKRSLGKKSL